MATRKKRKPKEGKESSNEATVQVKIKDSQVDDIDTFLSKSGITVKSKKQRILYVYNLGYEILDILNQLKLNSLDELKEGLGLKEVKKLSFKKRANHSSNAA